MLRSPVLSCPGWPVKEVTKPASESGIAAADAKIAAVEARISSLQELKQKQQETSESALTLKDAYRSIVELAVVEKIREFGKAAFDSAVNIERMSQKTGLSAQTLSVYGKAAEDVGVSQDSVDKSLTKLQQNIVKFQPVARHHAILVVSKKPALLRTAAAGYKLVID